MASATKFAQPCDYYGEYKTSSWAGYYFKEPLGYTSGFHTGIDVNGPGAGNADLGLPIRSIANGTVRYAGNPSVNGFGLVIIVEYVLPKSLQTELGCTSLFGRYLHLQNIVVSVGQEVTLGQQIATMGNSGTVWAHLHLDLYKDTIGYGGVHFNYDKDTELQSYLDPYEFIEAHLTDAPDTVNLLPYQRIVGASGVNHREKPNASAAIRQEWQPGEVLDFAGWVTGESVNGNSTWFVGLHTGGYLWSGAFTDPTTIGLRNLDPQPTPTPGTPAEPSPAPVPAMFPAESKLVSRVVPSPNFVAGPQTPQFIVYHQWDDPRENPTQTGVINSFLNPAYEVAAHYVVNDTEVVQMVKEADRAWHAGPEGNNGIGIEFDPNGGERMYALGRALLADIRSRWGALPLRRHNEFMETDCPIYINREELEPETAPLELELRVKALEDKLSNIKGIL